MVGQVLHVSDLLFESNVNKVTYDFMSERLSWVNPNVFVCGCDMSCCGGLFKLSSCGCELLLWGFSNGDRILGIFDVCGYLLYNPRIQST